MTVPDRDPIENPYAAPAAVSGDAPDPSRKRRGYRREVRSVLGMIGLMVVTLGLYDAIWYVLRREFIDSRRAEEKVGSFPLVLLVAHGFAVVIGAFAIASGSTDTTSASNMVSLALGIPGLVLRFRVARILRADFAATGRELRVSGFWTFFLGSLYLQHKINQAAGIPRRRAGALA